ncbi:MAG: DNA polymerase I [Pseudobdellovibrionaceae bacterium]|nr:DNA polymerase I [Bdellovibrionales bacterium]USN47415.1 MAG: DNA polymerase I [Pseudobdellovibrionaceae bacterium]
MKNLYLVDVSNMFFRAYYAIPTMNNSKGLPTNALYGFLAMSLKLLREIKPDYLVYCFDRKEPSFRNELYEEYKANRTEMPEDLVPQIPYIRKLTQALGIKDLDLQNYEADDIIGSLTEWGKNQGVDVTIVSGDKDFAQLVGRGVTLYDTMKNVRYDASGVAEKWGVQPEQIIDYLALVGDSSDNIPGVRGVGPKGAEKLLAEYKTLDGIYENIDKISGESLKQKLIDGKDSAYLARKLVTIVSDLQFDVGPSDLSLKAIDKGHLSELLAELEFQSFAKKLSGDVAVEQEPTPAGQQKGKKSTSKSAAAPGAPVKVSSLPVDKLKTETWSLEKLDKKVTPYSEIWAVINERGFCLGVGDTAVQVEASLNEVGQVLDNKWLSWSGFDLKQIWTELKLEAPGHAQADQMLSAYVYRPGNVTDFSKVYNQISGQALPDLASPSDILAAQLQLAPLLADKVVEVKGEGVLKTVELPLIKVLYQMERRGIGIDKKELHRQSETLAVDIAYLEKKIFKEAGESFNISSPKQLAEVLFNKMGLPAGKKTKTGYSTNSDVLGKLVNTYPIAQYVLDYRELAKLKSTYVDALPEMIDSVSGRVHTNFRQALTATGRLSSANPNLQNIPIRTERGREVRKAFVAAPGCQFISVDYSQIELRILAEISGDEGLLRAFNHNLDVHAATASEIFDVKLEDVSPEMRRMAKAVNFGIAYGQGVFGLSETLNIDRGEAAEIINNYFSRFKRVKDYMESTVAEAYKTGYVETLFGRRRYIDELKSRNNNLKKFGERAAINAPIQGTASDIVKLAMISVFNDVSAKMILQVHDELLFECPTDELNIQSQEIQQLMENVVSLKVPLKVNVASGNNWEDAHA